MVINYYSQKQHNLDFTYIFLHNICYIYVYIYHIYMKPTYICMNVYIDIILYHYDKLDQKEV